MALFDPTSLQQNNVSLLQCDIFSPVRKEPGGFKPLSFFSDSLSRLLLTRHMNMYSIVGHVQCLGNLTLK